jgi:hypothetical protein
MMPVVKMSMTQRRKLRTLAQQHGLKPDELIQKLLTWYHTKADAATKREIRRRAQETN